MFSADSNSGKGMGFSTGTSFAAPMVAGAAAVIMVQHDLVGAAADDYLIQSATENILQELPINTRNRLLHLPKVPSKLSGRDDDYVLVKVKGMGAAPQNCNSFTEILAHSANECLQHSEGVVTSENHVINAFVYTPHLNKCVPLSCGNTFQIWASDNDADSIPGSVKVFARKEIVPEQLSGFILTPVTERNMMYSCFEGNVHTLKRVESVYDCLLKAEFVKANGVNFHLGTGTCELLSCPTTSPFEVTMPGDESNDWVSYKSYLVNLAQATTNNFRLIGTNRGQFLNSGLTAEKSCQGVNTVSVTTESSGEACSQVAATEGGNAFQMIYGTSRCEIFDCSSTNMLGQGYSYPTFYLEESQFDFYLSYVREDVFPLKFGGYSLLQSNNYLRLVCDSYTGTLRLTPEECAMYTTEIGGNGFNYNALGTGKCFPLSCKEDYEYEATTERYLIYLDETRLRANLTELYLVHVNPMFNSETFQSLIDVFQNHGQVESYSAGDCAEQALPTGLITRRSRSKSSPSRR